MRLPQRAAGQDKAATAHCTGLTFIPSVFGSPHLVAVHAPGWQPVVRYPVSPSEPVSLETVTLIALLGLPKLTSVTFVNWTSTTPGRPFGSVG